MRRWHAMTWSLGAAFCAAAAGCRTAVVTVPRSDRTQTVVTVEERPTTQPADKGLIVRDKR